MTRRADLPDVLKGHYTLSGNPLTHLGYRTPGPTPYTTRVTVRECCAARGLSVYQVAMSGHSQGTVDPGTVYRLARGDTSRIDLDTLATLAGIIHTLTGQPVGVGELLALEVSGEEK
ncbi:helix-turn-helix transcriptional regulator [Deinococcus frigens]|uniref:helix-turn-helix transcriptional regulator n=1 Tax=Deinococcus frigens TaxID=249403 RepID=UPI00049552D9|nr:helix-turn-helix transcriptional regulator [Deinococcus frigens]